MKIKLRLIAVLILLAIYNIGNAQDIITFLNRKDIKVKVLEVTTTEVKYKKFENMDGPIFTTAKDDIMKLVYENGTVESSIKNEVVKSGFDEKVENVNKESSLYENLYRKEYNDSQKYYQGYGPAGTGTLITTLLTGGIGGLIPAIACSSTPPADFNLGIKNANLAQNPEYKNGYKEGARVKKSRMVWTNFGLGCAVNVVVYFAVIRRP